MLLDEVVFEQQRLGLGVGDRDLDARDVADQRLHFRIDIAGEEVVADAVAQAARLADVQQLRYSLSGPFWSGAEYMRYTPGRRGRFAMKSLASNGVVSLTRES